MTKKVLTEKEQRLATFQADYTPFPVVYQGLQYLANDKTLFCNPLTMLDCAAGAGVFAKAAKLVWPNINITSIEPREEEREHLLECSEIVYIDYLENLLNTELFECIRWDLIITNPPFNKIAPKNWKEESWIPKLLPLLSKLRTGSISTGSKVHAPMLGFYALNDVGQRSEAGAALFEEFPPKLQMRVCGPISHRADGKVDVRDYSWWIWQPSMQSQTRSNNPPEWHTVNLPRLSAKDRRLGNHEMDKIQ